MVWGTFLEKNFPSSNGHFLDFGGVWTLARMVWNTYTVKIEVKMAICLCVWVCVCEGGGVQSLFGKCPNWGDMNSKGASLMHWSGYPTQDWICEPGLLWTWSSWNCQAVNQRLIISGVMRRDFVILQWTCCKWTCSSPHSPQIHPWNIEELTMLGKIEYLWKYGCRSRLLFKCERPLWLSHPRLRPKRFWRQWRTWV